MSFKKWFYRGGHPKGHPKAGGSYPRPGDGRAAGAKQAQSRREFGRLG